MRTRRAAAWLALFAIALQALFPLLAQAQPRRVALVAICSAGEPGRTIVLPLHEPAASEEHCPLCFVGSDVPILLAPPEIRLGKAIAPPLRSLSFLGSHGDWYTPALPRAPPFLA